MDRRAFTAEAARALLGGAVIAIGGCRGANPAASSSVSADAVGTITANHGHSAVITGAQLAAGGALNVDIRGTSGHGHSVSLSADEVVSIRNGARVQKESSNTNHTHTVTFNA